MKYLDDFLSYLLSNDILLFGTCPTIVSLLAYLITSLTLEILISQSFMQSSLITYPKSGNRKEAIKRTQLKYPLINQFFQALFIIVGPRTAIGSIIGYYLFKSFISIPNNIYPNINQFLLQFVSMELLGDFFLYWGHRIQHEIPYLWNNHHFYHHQLDTPTPIGSIYIDSVDATLQAVLPLIITILSIRPHPITMLIYIYCRVSENVLNHSGLDSSFINLVTLKFLPGRAPIGHHDAHHRYSNYAANAKNYGENFWIWDYIFGTMRNVSI